MIKVVSSGFYLCLGPFNMLNVKGRSEMAFFRTKFWKVFNFGYILAMTMLSLKKSLRFDEDSKKGTKSLK